jgi:hypothetical protein
MAEVAILSATNLSRILIVEALALYNENSL